MFLLACCHNAGTVIILRVRLGRRVGRELRSYRVKSAIDRLERVTARDAQRIESSRERFNFLLHLLQSTRGHWTRRGRIIHCVGRHEEVTRGTLDLTCGKHNQAGEESYDARDQLQLRDHNRNSGRARLGRGLSRGCMRHEVNHHRVRDWHRSSARARCPR